MFKRCFVLCILWAAVAMGAWAQVRRDAAAKLSVTTQMFLDEMAGKLSYDELGKERYVGGQMLEWAGLPPQRLYAAPDTVEGRAYISAFVRLAEVADTEGLKALGVVVQRVFKECSLLTALIPVERVSEVAELESVRRVSVAELMTPMTDVARGVTNAGDVLTHTAEALRQGLAQGYDGSGVLLGVLDVGIDFRHIAFKDSEGNSRIARAYVYNGGTGSVYDSVAATALTTDDNTGDHGTHTATTAGGSSVVVSGSTVAVTDDHAHATYGGMAPGARLCLAGAKGLNQVALANITGDLADYADSEGAPLVVSNSWGSQSGPHDGTGLLAAVYNSLFNDSHPNRIALFATGNYGGKSKDGEGGGYHVYGTASAASPLGTIVRSNSLGDADGGYFYQGWIVSAWARNTGVGSLAVRVHVLDASTGAILHTVDAHSHGLYTNVGDYYTGSWGVYYDQVESDKTQVVVYSLGGLTAAGYSNDDGYIRSNYTLAVEVYPYNSNATTVVDIWGGGNGYFTSHLTTGGHEWTAGSDDMSVSNEATIANVITVGAYVSKMTWTDYDGRHWRSATGTVGDIASFSSYATAEASPTGQQCPWIAGPGARLAAGVNHYHTTSVDNNSYYGSNRNNFLVVNNAGSPYAMMQGTSMATPVVAGIVALWLQQAREHNIDLTVSDVKNIMRSTAIHDAYTTTGDNASHFGNGKINALGFVAPSWQGGGTAADPYLITTTAEMDRLACNVNIGIDYGGKYFRLANDIAYDSTTPNNYTPVGCNYADGRHPHAFNGIFDGYGNSISGIVAMGDDGQGVFGLLGADGGVVDLTVASSTFAGNNDVGAVVGNNQGSVSGCFAKEVVVMTGDGGSSVGAVVGSSSGTLSGNYYYHCSLQNSSGAFTSGIGYGGDGSTQGPCDIVAGNGAVEVYRLTLADGITSTGGVSYSDGGGHYCRANATVTLSYQPTEGYDVSLIATKDDTDPIETVHVGTSGGAYSLTMPAADITVAPGVAMAIVADSWYAIASPMHDDGQSYQTLSHVVGLTNGSYDMFYFDEPTGTWINQKTTGTGFDAMQRGRGYIYRRASDALLGFVGLANAGSYNVGLTAGCADEGLRGFNLVGNPYPHSVGLDRAYYTLQPNGIWLAHNGGALAVGQAAMVYTGSGSTLPFADALPTPTAKGDNAKTIKQSNNQAIKTIAFTLSDGIYEDRAIACLADGNELPKMAHLNTEAPRLSIGDYAVRMLGGNTQSFLLSAYGSGEYTLTVSLTGSMGYLHLVDNLMGDDIDLLRENSYTVHLMGSDADRFTVRLSPEGEDAPFAYVSAGSVVVQGCGTLQVFDVMGRLLFTQELGSGRSLSTFDTQLFPGTGVYILRLGGKTQKVVIRIKN